MPKRPHIEISYGRGEESFSASDIKATLIGGFGLHQAWMLTTMFGPEKTFSAEASDLGFFTGLYFSISLLVFVVSLFLHAAFGERLHDRFCSRRTVIVAAALTAASTVTVVGSEIPGIVGMACFLFGSVVSGLSSCLLILLWGYLFSDCDIPSIVVNSILAYALGMALYSLVVNQLPYPLPPLVAATFPLIEGYMICRSLVQERVKTADSFVPRSLPIRKDAFARQVCMPFLLFGVAMGLMGQSSLRAVLTGNDPANQIVVVASACLAALLLIICVFATQSQTLHFLYRPLLPITAVSLLLIPQLSGFVLVAHLMLLLGYLCLEALMWETVSEICSRYRIAPLLAFGLMRGCLAAGTLLVDIVQRWHVMTTGEPLVLTDFMVVAVALVALVCGYVLLPNEQDLAALVVKSAEEDEDDEAVEETGEVEARRTEDDPSAEESDAERDRKAGKFVRRCQTLADQHLLTRKETEILFLLAKGNNAAAIQEQLVISENTVRTHMRHIYRKLDVHTQQEIINLVDRR